MGIVRIGEAVVRRSRIAVRMSVFFRSVILDLKVLMGDIFVENEQILHREMRKIKREEKRCLVFETGV